MPRGSGSKPRGSSGTRATKTSGGSGGKASSSGATKPSSSTPKASSRSSAKTSGYGAQTSSSATKESHSGIDDLVHGTNKMTLEDRYTYRVCRKDEDISKDIVSKAKQGTPDAKRTVNQHINSGSKKDSPYISTTASPKVAQEWAYYTKENPKDVREREEPLRIVKIDRSKMDGKPIDLTKASEREKYVSGATQINRAKSSQEVLFQDRIPKRNSRGENVFEEWKNPPKPEMPK